MAPRTSSAAGFLRNPDSERPIGITTFEDKIVQKAVAMLLEAVYEEDFVEESYGFRRGRGAHDAIRALRDGCMASRCRRLIDADDFVLGFQVESDAERVMKVLPKRFGKYGLTIHPQKSKQLNFRKPIGGRNDTDSFDFLGFTHFWGRARSGSWVIKRRTSSKKLRAKMTALKEWCKERMHAPLHKQWEELCSKLLGHYQYYGVIGNYKQLEVYYEHAISVWRRSVNRRNSKNLKSHEAFKEGILSNNPLPVPRIRVRC